jgi:hypothetical protein
MFAGFSIGFVTVMAVVIIVSLFYGDNGKDSVTITEKVRSDDRK